VRTPIKLTETGIQWLEAKVYAYPQYFSRWHLFHLPSFAVKGCSNSWSMIGISNMQFSGTVSAAPRMGVMGVMAALNASRGAIAGVARVYLDGNGNITGSSAASICG
jgi:hypothetical protein